MPLNGTELAMGRGLAYPFRFDEAGQVAMVADEANVRARLVRLLSTEPGEDPFLYRGGVPYGIRFSQVMFADFAEAKSILEFEARLAIETWEPGVQLLGIQITKEFQRNPDRLVVYSVISYRIRDTGKTGNVIVSY